MKTMELTPTTAAFNEVANKASKVRNFKQATGNFFKAACAVILEISLAYPEYLERQERDLGNLWG